jgi:bifunctional enzyme CysN/CysC
MTAAVLKLCGGKDTCKMQSDIEIDKEQMNVVFVGHVDHGKSTIVGRLLADTNSLPKGKLEQLQEKCRKNGKPFEYAFLIDALKDEQSQAITIDAARVFFQSKFRNYIILDAPGHIEFIKNMVTGASHAEAAVLVIDAAEGVQENSRRHGYLLCMLGIKKIVVAVNKMDLVGYKQETFTSIVEEYSRYLSGIGVKAMTYIPVSGHEGDNVSNKSRNMPWYQGTTLLGALDAFEKDEPVANLPLRLPVQDIYKFSDYGDSRRIIAGNISSGKLKVGDELVFYPSGKRTKIKTIESFNTPKITGAASGQAVGITMQEQIYIRRGEIASRTGDNPPFVSSLIRASIFWLGKEPLVTDKEYLLKLGTTREKVKVAKIHKIIDASNYASQTEKTAIMHHDVAEVTFKLAHPIAFDTSEKFPETSRFVLVDGFEIRGGGIVLESLQDSETQIRAEVFTRNEKWVQSLVTMEDRAEKYNQRSSLIVVTGPKGVGRKTLARKLESQLFEAGKLVYYLGIGSLLYGVNADLKRLDAPGGWRENIRRFAEVSHLFLDAGIIFIVTAIELTQEDLDILKTVVGEDKIQVVWVGEKVTTDITYDVHIKDHENLTEGVVMVKHMLQERGIIFKP